jgi:pSer/pThr/pTyr-binding forkhead associated (FHA) protein
MKPRGPHLIVQRGNLTGRIYEITKKATVVGRDPSCEVVVNDVSISRMHVRITLEEGGTAADGDGVPALLPRYTLEDLGSTNGTFVNGKQITGVVTITFDDEILLGSDVFILLKEGFFRPPPPEAQKPEETERIKPVPKPARPQQPTRKVDVGTYAGLELESLSPDSSADDDSNVLPAPPTEPEAPKVLREEADAEQEPCDIFISYSRKDREVMNRVYDTLVGHDFSVWVDQKLQPGEPSWRRAVERAIDHAECLLLILSPDAKKSKWVEAELDYAETQHKRIFCILARGDRSSTALLGYTLLQWVDIQVDYDRGMRALVQALRDHMKPEA